MDTTAAPGRAKGERIYTNGAGGAEGNPRKPQIETTPSNCINPASRSVNRPDWIRLSFGYWERLSLGMPPAVFAAFFRLYTTACQFEGRLPMNRLKLSGLTGLTGKQIAPILRDYEHLFVVAGDELVVPHAAEETRRAISRRDTNRQNASAGGKKTQSRREIRVVSGGGDD